MDLLTIAPYSDACGQNGVLTSQCQVFHPILACSEPSSATRRADRLGSSFDTCAPAPATRPPSRRPDSGATSPRHLRLRLGWPPAFPRSTRQHCTRCGCRRRPVPSRLYVLAQVATRQGDKVRLASMASLVQHRRQRGEGRLAVYIGSPVIVKVEESRGGRQIVTAPSPDGSGSSRWRLRRGQPLFATRGRHGCTKGAYTRLAPAPSH